MSDHQIVTLRADDTVAEVVPARGAIVTRLAVAGRELLYLDRDTLADASKNVRGGIPLLFPFAGRLPDDKLVGGGTMKQHGFGRTSSWTIAANTAAQVRMTLAASDATRAVFPWEFTAEHAITALPDGMRIELTVTNHTPTPMPLAPGWHPYFICPATAKHEVTSDVPGFRADRLTNDAEFDFGLPAPASGVSRFELPNLGALTLEVTPAMRHLQFWSLPGKPFVCLEPFWGPAGTINDPKTRAEVGTVLTCGLILTNH